MEHASSTWELARTKEIQRKAKEKVKRRAFVVDEAVLCGAESEL